MRSFALVCAVLAGGAATLMLAAPAQAQATRTWVSGVGDDANPCSRTAPCKTFAGAISKTAAKGEINCIDPGGFGALTITKSISVVCDYTEGGVLAASFNGFVVNAAATDKVYISGLDFHSTTDTFSGIRILNAQAVVIKNVRIQGFLTGIDIANTAAGTVEVSVIDSVVTNNAGVGISVQPATSGSARVSVSNTQMVNNVGAGILASTNATTGTVNVSVRDSVAAHNGGNGFAVLAPTVSAQMMLDASMALNNNTGIVANGAAARVRFARTNVTGNATGVSQVSSGIVQSYSPASNTVDGNTADGTFGTTPFE